MGYNGSSWEEEPAMLESCLTNLRCRAPLIHNITNYVTINDVANVLLACGASPIMSDEPSDIEEITSTCDGLNLNLGTLHRWTIDAMFTACRRARELGHVITLDPVGVGASSLRRDTALAIMEQFHPDAIRGNASEIRALAVGHPSSRGVDADAADRVTEENLDFMVAFTRDFAARTGSIIVLTGAIDLVADAGRCFVIRNGRPEMGRVTGTGCQLSALLAAFLVSNPACPLEAAAAAVCTMGLAGELAWEHLQPGEGSGALRGRIIDAIFHLDEAALRAGAKYEIRDTKGCI